MKRMVVANSICVCYTNSSLDKGCVGMRKRLLSVVLSVAMLITMVPAAFAASDLDGHWSKKFIEYLDREGVINPSATTGKYEPNRDMTRAEFMRYINRAFHFTEKAEISYADVASNAWYYETVQIAAKYGYINGTGNNRMDPQGKVTREQAAVVIGRLFKADPGDISASELPFADKDQISKWAAGYIKAAADKGFLAGYSDGTFRPKQVVTRGEVAKILYYYMGTSLSSAGRAYTGADLKTDTTNVTISENCTLSDAIIEGDLYITEGVGADVVTLNNVTVNGSIIISGGTVTMMNTTCDHMIVSSPMGRLLQVTATGDTRIGQTDVQTAAALYESGQTEGFADVAVAGDGRVSLTLDAEITNLEIENEATVSTTASTSVYHMQVRQPASVTGYGVVYQADIHTDGVSFASSLTVSGYTLPDGVTATIGGQTVNTSNEADVAPDSIAVDLNDLDALGTGVNISVPADVSVSSVTCGSKTLSAESDYTATDAGIRVQASYLGSLPRGSHTLILALSDGSRANVVVEVEDSSWSSDAQTVSFDRYYKSVGFRDLSIQLDGVNAESDIEDVVLGLSRMDYDFNDAARTLELRRGLLAQLRAGTHTITVDLADGDSRTIVLTVEDSTPDHVSTYVAEYDTYAPAELRFSLPLDSLTVREVTAVKNGTVQALTFGTDYMVSADELTLTQAGLERFRKSNGYVEFSVTLSNDSVYTLVVDYISG